MAISHYSSFKTRWNWVILVMTFYTSIVVPFVVAFSIKIKSNVWLMAESTVDVFFFVDVVINFYTTYVNKKGEIVRDLRKIRIHYLKTWFILDMVSCFPFDALLLLNVHIQNENLAHMVGVLKATRLVRLLRFDRYMHHACLSLVALMGLILLVCHWLACGWYVVALVETKEYLRYNEVKFSEKMDDSVTRTQYFPHFSTDKNTFPDFAMFEFLATEKEKQEMTNELVNITAAVTNKTAKSWLVKLSENLKIDMEWDFEKDQLTKGPPVRDAYISCMYFAMTTLSGAGYGNVAANTTNERLYCIGMMLIGCLLYANILANVTVLVMQMLSRRRRFYEMYRSVTTFVKFRKLPKHFTKSITDYVAFSYLATHGMCLDKVMDRLPTNLQIDVGVFLYRNIAESLFIFSSLPESSIRHMVLKFERVIFAPNEQLYLKGEHVNHINIILSGSLEIKQNNKVVGIIGRNDSVGLDFWSQMHRKNYTCYSKAAIGALTYVVLVRISKEDLLEAIKKFKIESVAKGRYLHLTYDLEKQTVEKAEVVETVHWLKEAAATSAAAKRDDILKRWVVKHQKKVYRARREKKLKDLRRQQKFSDRSKTNEKNIAKENIFVQTEKFHKNTLSNRTEKEVQKIELDKFLSSINASHIIQEDDNDDVTNPVKCYNACDHATNTPMTIMFFIPHVPLNTVTLIARLRISLECGCWMNLPLSDGQKQVLHSILKLKVESENKLRELNQRMRMVESQTLKVLHLVKAKAERDQKRNNK